MADQEVSKIMWIAIVVALGASVFVIAKPQINSLAGQTFDKIESIVKGDDSGGGGDDGNGETPPEDKATLVAPTGVLKAETSAFGVADGTLTLPDSLKDSKGEDVSVTAKIVGESGEVQNGKLAAGDYDIQYFAEGYDSVTQKAEVTQPEEAKLAALVAPAAATLETPGFNKTVAFNTPTTLKDADGNDVQVKVLTIEGPSADGQGPNLKALARGSYTLTYVDTDNKREPVTQTVTVKDKVNTPTFTVQVGGKGANFYVSGDANAPYEIRHTGLNKTITGTFDASGNDSYSEMNLGAAFGIASNQVYDDRSKLQIRVVQPDGSSAWVTCVG